MKKIILLFFIITSGIGYTSAQDLSNVIMSMPKEIILPISDDQKELLLDAKNKDTVIVQNTLNGDVERLSISSDFIKLKTSDIGTTQIKLLPLINNSYIVGVIQTVCDSLVCDSQIRFYTTDWKPLDNQSIISKRNKDIFIQSTVDRSSQVFKNAYAALDMTPVELKFSPNNQSLELVYNIEGYLSVDDYKLIKPYLITKPIILNWDKSSFN